MDKGGPPPQPLSVLAGSLLACRYRLPRGKQFSQTKFLNFAAGRHRKLIHTLQPFRPERARNSLIAEERAHLLERERFARLGDDARACNLTKTRVGQPDQDYTSDLGVSQEQVLNLLDRDVLATADDDVLAPAGNADEPHDVHHRPIAGREPAIWCEVLLGKAPTLHIADEEPERADVVFGQVRGAQSVGEKRRST